MNFYIIFQLFIKIRPSTCLLDVLDGESWWEGLLKFLGFVSILDLQGVKVSGASDLEFGLAGLVDLDRNGLGVLPSGLQEEILNFGNLLRHASLFCLLKVRIFFFQYFCTGSTSHFLISLNDFNII